MSGTGGEPHPDMSKVEGPVLSDRMGGEALQRPDAPPQPSREWEENLALARAKGKARTPAGAGFRPRRQGRLHPDSYGSRVPSATPRKTSPGLLREPGSIRDAKEDFTRTPTGAGFHPRHQEKLHPDSYGSRAPSTTPRKIPPGLLREPGSTHDICSKS